MRRTLAAATGTVLAVCAAFLAGAPQAQAADPTAGFHVQDGRLLDASGKDFVLRGVNHAHTWYPDRTTQALKDIKARGANSVRVVLATGDQWTKNDTADVAEVVGQCKANRLVCILEAHDTTGYGEAGAAAPLSKAVDYWLGVKSALVGQEKYVLVNIGNEPYGNTGYTAWTADTKTAIGRLRAGGIDHTLLVDAPNWGQDWSFTMRDNAAGVFAADPDRNTVFDIHMYGVYDTAAEVSDYVDHFVSAGLPLVIGEFGNMHSDGDPDEDAIMATAQARGIGYLGWSWSGNGGGVEYLDLVQGFDATRMTTWGQRLFNGANGIKATAKEAGVFSDGGNNGGDNDRAHRPRHTDRLRHHREQHPPELAGRHRQHRGDRLRRRPRQRVDGDHRRHLRHDGCPRHRAEREHHLHVRRVRPRRRRQPLAPLGHGDRRHPSGQLDRRVLRQLPAE